MKIKTILIRVAVLLLCVALGAVMMLIGRGHTVYFDNKTLEYEGQTYKAYYKVEVNVKNAKTAKLYARERGSATWMGQNFHMDLSITREEGDEPQHLSIDFKLPYGMDGPVLNLPGMLAGLPRETWLDEFVPTPSQDEGDTDVSDIGDAFAVDAGDDFAE